MYDSPLSRASPNSNREAVYNPISSILFILPPANNHLYVGSAGFVGDSHIRDDTKYHKTHTHTHTHCCATLRQTRRRSTHYICGGCLDNDYYYPVSRSHLVINNPTQSGNIMCKEEFRYSDDNAKMVWRSLRRTATTGRDDRHDRRRDDFTRNEKTYWIFGLCLFAFGKRLGCTAGTAMMMMATATTHKRRDSNSSRREDDGRNNNYLPRRRRKKYYYNTNTTHPVLSATRPLSLIAWMCACVNNVVVV